MPAGRPKREDPPFDPTKMSVGRTTHARLSEVKRQIEAYEQRTMTFSEVLDILVRHWESTGELIRDAIKDTRT